jgi:hypothetical protein
MEEHDSTSCLLAPSRLLYHVLDFLLSDKRMVIDTVTVMDIEQLRVSGCIYP